MKIHFVFFFLLILYSCELNEDDDRSCRPKSVSAIDLSDAEYFAIDKGARKKTGDSSWSNIFKLVKSNQSLVAQKIGFLDDKGELIDSLFTKIFVSEIYPISEKYICLIGQFEIEIDSLVGKLVYSSLLVDLIDGFIYDFNGHFPELRSYYYDQSYLQSDEEGNFYYEYASTVYKLGTNQNIMSQEMYVSASQFLSRYFYISGEANCYFRGDNVTKVKMNTGGILIFDGLYADIFGSNGRIFARYFNSGNNLYELKIVDDKCMGEVINNFHGNHEELFHFIETSEYSYVITNSFFATDDYYAGIFGFAYDSESNTLIELCVPIVDKGGMYDIIRCMDNFIWASSAGSINKKFIRLDITKFEIKKPLIYEPGVELGELISYDEIEFPSNLEVSDYHFLDNSEISFKAFDLSEEKDITGIINLEGEITITELSDKYTYEILKKLN